MKKFNVLYLIMGNIWRSIKKLSEATKGPLNRTLRFFKTRVRTPNSPKILFIFILFLCCETLSVSNLKTYKYSEFYYTVQTQRDYALECASRIFKLNEICAFIIDTAIEESVDPLEVLAYIKNENPNLNPKAIGRNIKYEKVWNKKAKKFLIKKVVLSEDKGIGQFNSKYINIFVNKYWYEDEKFDVFNYRHNIKVSIRLYKDLRERLNCPYLATMAYNAGVGSVLRSEIPEKTIKVYLKNWLKNIDKMKGI